MKKRIMFASVSAIIFSACSNNQSTTNAQHDSTSHSASGQNTNHNPMHQADSSSSAMDMMHTNMQAMKNVPSSGDPDTDFAALMRIHHMGAVEMAEAEVARGTNAEMKAMAQKMIDAQKSEIAMFDGFLSNQQNAAGGDAFYKEVMSQMDNMKMNMNHSGSFDKQFVEMMIPHHQGAVDMSTAYLKAGGNEEKLKAMAQKIISDQQKEIQVLQAWLQKNQ